MAAELAIIGGSGLTAMETLKITRREVVHTPYGEPSAPITFGMLGSTEVAFLPRHGMGHTIPPHQINYQANLWAVKHIGVKQVLGVAAVGGITADMPPACIVIPDQIIDYTWGRKHTFFEDDLNHVTHIDFTRPYCQELRLALLDAGRKLKHPVIAGATYGATQGPRLETAMEVDRLDRDGCDMVGMTGMPEAALARELELCYASCAVVANWAAGRGEGGSITMAEIERNLLSGMEQVRELILKLTFDFKV